MTPTGNPIQEQSDRTHAEAMEAAAMAGWLLLYGAWQGTAGGATLSEADLMVRCYDQAQMDLDQLREGLRDDSDDQAIHDAYFGCRAAIIAAIREPARVVRPIGLTEAQSMMREFETAARTAEREGLGFPEEINLSQRECDGLRVEIEELLSRTVDFRRLYLESESEAEGLSCELSSLKRALREAGTGVQDAHDLRCLIDTLRGDVLAAEQRRDETAAHFLSMLDILRQVRTNDMNSGLEAQHHAVVASPRTLETEKISYALLQERVAQLYGKRLSESMRQLDDSAAQLENEISRNAQLERRIDSTIELYQETIADNDARYRELETRHKWMLNISILVMAGMSLVVLAQAVASLLG